MKTKDQILNSKFKNESDVTTLSDPLIFVHFKDSTVFNIFFT